MIKNKLNGILFWARILLWLNRYGIENTNPCIFLENMSELGYKLIGITSIDNYVFEKVKSDCMCLWLWERSSCSI